MKRIPKHSRRNSIGQRILFEHEEYEGAMCLQKNVIINLDWLIVGCACRFSRIHVCGQHMDILHTNICLYIHTYILYLWIFVLALLFRMLGWLFWLMLIWRGSQVRMFSFALRICCCCGLSFPSFLLLSVIYLFSHQFTALPKTIVN